MQISNSMTFHDLSYDRVNPAQVERDLVKMQRAVLDHMLNTSERDQ